MKQVIRFPRQPTAWVCPVCRKVDFPGIKKQLARPWHVSYRGVDIGQCKGITGAGGMIAVYSEDDIRKANQEEAE